MIDPCLPPPIVRAHRGPLPVLLSVPHAGRDYPDWLVDLARSGRASLEPLEDPYVDRLVWRAVERGCGAVIATAPRAAVDCNRAEDEVDPAVVVTRTPVELSPKARGGLGIVPARTRQHGFLWRRAISPAQLDERLEAAYRPFHAAIARDLLTIRAEFGTALLIDCHSMPPPRRLAPSVIIGDAHGRSARGWLSAEALAIVRAQGFAAGHNDPFAGGRVLDRHGRPSEGIHAIQIEIDRRLYLDDALREPGLGFDQVARLIEALASGLGEMLIGRTTAAAAE